MSHLKKLAGEFAAIAIPPEAGPAQRDEMLKAFYSGYAQCLAWQMFAYRSFTPAEAKQRFQEAYDECTAAIKTFGQDDQGGGSAGVPVGPERPPGAAW